MTRDYKNTRDSNPRGNTRKKRSPAKGAAPRTPGWVWLLTGLSVGLLVALGVYLYNRNHEATLAQQASAIEKPASAIEKPASANKDEQKPPNKNKATTEKITEEEPRFDFYTLLPKQEVVIPESEILEEQQRMAPKENVIYSIQAGSFRRYADADALKARLALLGIEAEIQSVQGKEETWQRVRIGPFNSSRELNRVRNRLNSNNISSLVIKELKK